LALYNNGQVFQPEEEMISLAEIFRSRGYETAAFVSLGVLQAKFGLARGFSEYRDTPHPRRWYLDAGEIMGDVLKWFDEAPREKPVFLWVHLSDPHDPYAPPDLEPDLKVVFNQDEEFAVCTQRRENLHWSFPLRPRENVLRMEVLNPFPVPRDEYRVSFNDYSLRVPQGATVRYHGLDLLTRGTGRILALKQAGEIRISNPGGQADLEISAQANLNLFPSESRAGYLRETEFLDAQIGRLLNRLRDSGRLDRMIVCLAGDHGEGLGDHVDSRGDLHFGHIHYLQDVYVRIPLILVDPSLPEPGARDPRPASLLDIAPTLLHRLGWRTPSGWAGRDLLSGSAAVPRPLFFETYTPEAGCDVFGVLSPPWRLLFAPARREFLLYNRDTDPREQTNVFEKNRDLPAVQELTRDLARRARRILNLKREIPMDESTREMLKSLGYIR
jgi:arylsulfatase A-like enzyme